MPQIYPSPVEFRAGDVVLRGDHWNGPDSRQRIIFLHGGGQTRHSWGYTCEAAAQAGWDVLNLDLRGHGDSDWSPNGAYGVAANATDINHVTGEVGMGVVLVGASLGGLTALRVASENPQAVRALVLVDVVPRTSQPGVQRIRDFMTAHLDGFDTLEDVADSVASYTGRPRRRDLTGLTKNVRMREDGRWYWHWDPRMVANQRDIDTRPPIDPDELLAAARAVTAPVLIVRGGRSDVVTDEGVAELSAALTNVSVVEVSGAGHMVAGDQNDAFARTVLTFLGTLGDTEP